MNGISLKNGFGAQTSKHLVSPAQLDDPYAIYARLRQQEPVSYNAEFDAWLVSRHEDVVKVLKAPDVFSSSGVLKVKRELPPEVRAVLRKGIAYFPTLIDNDPPGHARFRGLVAKAFAPQQVLTLKTRICATADALIDGFLGGGAVDLMEHFAVPLPIFAIADILGLPRQDVHDLKRWCDDWMALQSGTAPLDNLIACARNYLEMQTYFIQKVEERTLVAEEDLISSLVHLRGDREAPLNRDELVRLLMSLLVAGHETTTHAIGNTLVLLLCNPTVLERLRQHPGLAVKCFEEGLRMDPPVQSLFRRVTRPVTICGVKIPAGARVMLLFGSAGRDELRYDRADHFDVERATNLKHLAFGKGIHFCLGALMARLEGAIALERLSRRLRGIELDKERKLERVDHFFLRGYKRLPVTWDTTGLKSPARKL
ncbi:cytochrome P450 (plasmid) [Ensifer adhaerens]|uniref:cytochrome P450 n=1 Tax=Ensifer adhaerens TaxID=106592 RepID=UPI002100D924|nr:cytochrome P450 [Ensifer adhaerens]UTV41914.1 cytochrome P450 [Ensifer adhaerens]